MHCPHCGQEHPDSAAFCPATGLKIAEKQYCRNCGFEMKPSWKACPKCGTLAVESQPAAPVIHKPAQKEASSGKRRRILPWVLAVVFLAVITIAGVAFLMLGQSQSREIPVQNAAATDPPVTSIPGSPEDEVILAFNAEIVRSDLTPPEGETFQPVDIQIEGEWVIIEATYVDKLATPTVGEGAVFIGRWIDGQWRIAIPGTELYREWLEAVPESLVPADLKQFLQ